jgi:hypothetical protein
LVTRLKTTMVQKRPIPRFIIGKCDPDSGRVEYATLPVFNVCGNPAGDLRAVLLFTSRARAEGFLRNHGRPGFVAMYLDYEHLARWIIESVREVAAVTVLDPLGDGVPRELWAFDLQEVVTAIEHAGPDADAVEADVFALLA